jgi:hypothetical protein
LTLVLAAGELSASCPDRFTPGEKAHGWVGTRVNLDDVERRKILPMLGLYNVHAKIQHYITNELQEAEPFMVH